MPFPINDSTRKLIHRHFRRKNLEWTEDYFLDVLENSKSKYDIYWAVLALRDCGTSRSIPYLSVKLYYPMQDVKCTSILTIAHIAGASETELYARALLDPKYREKGYAMWAIQDAADERAIEAVISYFRKNLSRIRSGRFHNGTLPDGLDYLQRFIDTKPEILGFFEDIRNCWKQLAEGERKTILERVPYFQSSIGSSEPAS
jgi:hypothetical protein